MVYCRRIKANKNTRDIGGKKIDRITNIEEAGKTAEEFYKQAEFDELIMVSAINHTNLDKLEEIIVSYLPDGPRYYPGGYDNRSASEVYCRGNNP